QHRRISRDLDIVLIDATDSRAAQRLLPVGLRREPLSSLSRADIVVLTRADQASQSVLSRLEDQVKRYQPQAVLAHASHRASHLIAGYGQEIPLEQLRGAQVLAFCGIGNPAAFFEGLSRLGSRVLATRAWPDHHAYTAADIEWLCGWEQQNPDAKLVCTLKDWVKIQEARIGHRDLWALAIEIDFLTGQKAIEAQLGTIIPR
ncbi:MAG TPA: tetraacyldisaccharide 4'-kinase, partial [Planctomycetaceae bacterium]|nr:tetraacyldisaccharide 4'-kinase [Planctomycetaceae bacterium]